MKKSLIFVIIFIFFSSLFLIYNSNKKYIILNNDYMFEVGKKIKVVKEFPSFLDNSKINYYDNTLIKTGYMDIKRKKLIIDQVKGDNIDFYTDNYKRIKSYNLLATYGLKEMKVLNLEGIVSKNIADKDKEIINNYLDKYGIDDFSIETMKKYSINTNNEGKEEVIYIFSNVNLDSINNTYSLEQKSIDDYRQCGFIFNGNSYTKIFDLNEENSSSIKYYELSNIFDLDNDSKYELNLSMYDYDDYNYHCESIFRLENGKYVEYKNCNMEDK